MELSLSTQRVPLVSRVRKSTLLLSLPIAFLALATSIAGLTVERIYRDETANWTGQAIGQDVVNLILYPLLLLCAWGAWRGSLRAMLGWLGILTYSAYTFAIYAFAVHFGPAFLAYVAIFGLSVYALGAGALAMDGQRFRARLAPRAPVKVTSRLLVAISVLFALLWLGEIVPATFQGGVPEALVDAGLFTNPVHVLDLALLLPALMFTGIALSKGRPWAYWAAPVLLVAITGIGAGIVSAMAALGLRGEGWAAGPALAVGLLTVVQAVVLGRFMASIDERS